MVIEVGLFSSCGRYVECALVLFLGNVRSVVQHPEEVESEGWANVTTGCLVDWDGLENIAFYRLCGMRAGRWRALARFGWQNGGAAG